MRPRCAYVSIGSSNSVQPPRRQLPSNNLYVLQYLQAPKHVSSSARTSKPEPWAAPFTPRCPHPPTQFPSLHLTSTPVVYVFTPPQSDRHPAAHWTFLKWKQNQPFPPHPGPSPNAFTRRSMSDPHPARHGTLDWTPSSWKQLATAHAVPLPNVSFPPGQLPLVLQCVASAWCLPDHP